MSLFEERGAYFFAHNGQSVRRWDCDMFVSQYVSLVQHCATDNLRTLCTEASNLLGIDCLDEPMIHINFQVSRSKGKPILKCLGRGGISVLHL